MNYRVYYWLLPSLLVACTPDTPAEQVAQAPAPTTPAAKATVSPTDTLASFHWDDEVCSYTGRYDSRKYTPQQLTDTRELFSSGALSTRTAVFQPSDIAKLSLDTLDAEYTSMRTRLRQLQPVPGATWQELKRLKLQELDDEYRASRLTIQGYSNPALLMSSTYSAACKAYVRGLAAANDSMIIASWQQLVREQQVNNSVPESLQERFQQEATTPNWHEYAKVALIGFGWGNCINGSIRRVELTEKMYRQYEQLFIKVKSECEDAD